jgi:transcriptional regulator with GAF, ATPase, and Fis domain
VGGSRAVRVDVRVIAATNRDLERMAKEGTFRTDLLYRLNVFPVHVPPLRERGDDVVLLAEAFAQDFARRRGGRPAPLTETAKDKLTRYEWPGNVRELQNVIERALITSPDGRRLNLDRALPDTTPGAPETKMATRGASLLDEDRILTAGELRDLERDNLLRALDAASWKISGAGGAAERLGVNPNTLGSRMKVLGVRRPGPPENS